MKLTSAKEQFKAHVPYSQVTIQVLDSVFFLFFLNVLKNVFVFSAPSRLGGGEEMGYKKKIEEKTA